ncbi:MAG: VOC family protein, partial [Devosia sp.]
MPRVFPHLWFKDQAEDAMAFYTSIFKDSKVLSRNVMPDPELSVVR